MLIKNIVRELRKNQTKEEKALWQKLRNRKLLGYKFLRQYPITYGNDGYGRSSFFVADFYCDKRRLIIELDGEVHHFQKEYDENRDKILGKMKFRILRIKNEELTDVEAVLRKICKALSENRVV